MWLSSAFSASASLSAAPLPTEVSSSLPRSIFIPRLLSTTVARAASSASGESAASSTGASAVTSAASRASWSDWVMAGSPSPVTVAVGDERDAAAEKREGGDAGEGEKQLRADAEPARARALGGGLLGGLPGDAEFDHGPLSENKLLEMRQPPARASVRTGLKAPSAPSTVRKTSAMPRLSSAA